MDRSCLCIDKELPHQLNGIKYTFTLTICLSNYLSGTDLNYYLKRLEQRAAHVLSVCTTCSPCEWLVNVSTFDSIVVVHNVLVNNIVCSQRVNRTIETNGHLILSSAQQAEIVHKRIQQRELFECVCVCARQKQLHTPVIQLFSFFLVTTHRHTLTFYLNNMELVVWA